MIERSGIIVWLHDHKAVRNLERYGTVYYISKRLHYAVMYVNTNQLQELTKTIQNLSYVKKVERSYRDEIPTEYKSFNKEKLIFDGIVTKSRS
jgi:uncharacterized protein YlbG (UPF0298 family)